MPAKKPELNIVELPAPAIQLEVSDLAALMLEKQALEAKIKELKASQPQLSPLEKVIRHQLNYFEADVVLNIMGRVRARVRAGQDRQTAMSEVVAFFANVADERLDMEGQDAEEANHE